MIVEAALLVERDSGPDRPGGVSEDHRRRRHARLHSDRAGLHLRRGAHLRRADLAPGDAREAAAVHHAALGGQAAEEPGVFRLPADRQIEDHRGALRAAGVRGSPGGDAAGVGRGGRRACIPKQFHIHNARERFREKGDLFRGVLERPQNLYDALAAPGESSSSRSGYFSVVRKTTTPLPRKTRSAAAFCGGIALADAGTTRP